MKGERSHFIGIGGIGMSGLAQLLLERGQEVSGSDIAENSRVIALQQQGAEIFSQQVAQNIAGASRIIYSSAIPDDHPELLAAQKAGLPCLHRSELLHSLATDSKLLAVAGTHGKTTTSSLLAAALHHVGYQPTYAVGGVIHELGSNAATGAGEHMVIEADESDGSLERYHPYGGIVLNVGDDHLDHYGSLDQLHETFERFIGQVQEPRLLFYCGDDAWLSKQRRGVSYGFGADCDLQVIRFRQQFASIAFDVIAGQQRYCNLELPLIGTHNALNATAVLGLMLALGVEYKKIQEAFRAFKGVGRRAEVTMECDGVTVFDDYAHHPTEIRATLAALKAADPSRHIRALFQPHRYRRTAANMGRFGDTFEDADEVWVTDIYSAGEDPLPGVTSEAIVEELRESTHPCSCYVPRKELLPKLMESMRPGDLIITLGAGDITQVAHEIAQMAKHA